MSTKHDPKTVTVYCYCHECEDEHHKIMELPTKQNKRIEELLNRTGHRALALELPSLVFDGYTDFLRENLPSLVRSIVMDALPPQNEEPHIGHEVPIETPDKKNYLVYCSQWNSYRRAFLDNLEKQGILPH